MAEVAEHWLKLVTLQIKKKMLMCLNSGYPQGEQVIPGNVPGRVHFPVSACISHLADSPIITIPNQTR